MVVLSIYLSPLLICLLAQSIQGLILTQITSNTMDPILQQYQPIYILFHLPSCEHSIVFHQEFVNINTQLILGVINCKQEEDICKHSQIRRFPSLAVVSLKSLELIDEQQFLVNAGVKDPNRKEAVLNRLVLRLKQPPHFAVVVLEEEGLQSVNRLIRNDTFYIESGSALHKNLLTFVGQRSGCWMLSYVNSSLNKYSCSTGDNPKDIQKYIDRYNKKEVDRYPFSQAGLQLKMDKQQMVFGQFKEMTANLSRKQENCTLVYFYSSLCHAKNKLDMVIIEQAIERNHLKKVSVRTYDIDYELLPQAVELNKVPELVSVCRGKLAVFGNSFSYHKITQFITSSRAKSTEPRSIEEESL